MCLGNITCVLLEMHASQREAVEKLYKLIVEYASGLTEMSRIPWDDIKESLGNLRNTPVGSWKTTEFSAREYQLEKGHDGNTLIAHFTNQLRRVPEEHDCILQRVLQVAFNVGRALYYGLLKVAPNLDYFVELH